MDRKEREARVNYEKGVRDGKDGRYTSPSRYTNNKDYSNGIEDGTKASK